MKKILLSIALAVGVAAPVAAGDAKAPVSKNPTCTIPAPASLYNAKEFQFDIYGTHSFADPLGPDDWGGGLGANFFFSRYFGIGAEGQFYDTPGDIAGTAAINAIFRYPIGETGLAPYAYAGGGIIYNAEDIDYDDFSDAFDRFFDGDDARAGDDVLIEIHAGAGIEYRCTSHMGVFVDGRYTWTDLDDFDFATVRAGVRFVF